MFTYRSNYLKPFLRKLLLMLPLLTAGGVVTAQTTSGAPAPSIWDNPLALTMLAIIFVLLLVIALLANVVLGTARLHFDKQRKKNNAAQTITAIALFLLPMMASAQETAEAAAPEGPTSIGGLSATTFWLLSTVIAIEFLVIIVMGLFVKSFLAKEKVTLAVVEETAAAKPSSFKVWWDKLNSFKPMEQEADIDLGHDYDGIRELDNRMPPWWIYGFYLTIIVAGIYIWRYHIAETAPLSKQEFEIAMKHAEEEKAAYLAKAANNIDENTVTLITDKAAIDAGKNNFIQMCAACHGKAGEGIVGPNLTDDYWLNGGSIKDIFKTIKYGRPEKGMKSWQDDYSPVQIAQLASFIKSLHGTNPPNAKDKQGDLYKENAAPAQDSATAKKDVVSN
ncbi:cbb3-type cytochrome c oxidase N-terminal domain-containing protein [Lacibacter sp.]|uniref:cbb3-type cytochrome c oxidase N-terminal domain-containing protein n=1 Tax=Lacibacter sp. TaxID=1915409 RepID=UPI002B4B03A1|nr:cbb3-type cytochrome c oxidase N-terminal domain-containing protein [Lacibacter sp.]HLP35216.1 cbb3-type cytochrome c oxidase N-terminal domain-containing protein [Lacibacter sp.]